MSAAAKPGQYFIIPDQLLVGETNVVSVTSQAGPYPGVTGANADSLGRLLPVQAGADVLTVSAQAVEYKLARAGGTDTAEFVWRREADGANDYIGVDDPRRFRWWNYPFSGGGISSDNCSLVYSKAFRVIVAIEINPSTNLVTIARREIDADRYDVWDTSNSFTLEPEEIRTGGVVAGEHGSTMIELPDGRLLMAVTIVTFGTQIDFDLYTSADGGVSWARTARLIYFTSTASTLDLSEYDANNSLRMAIAGEHIRLCWVDDSGSPSVITSLHSKDRGATWKLLTSTRNVDDNGDADDGAPYSIIGVDDQGLFLLAHVESGSPTNVSRSFARGDGNWSTVAGSESIHPKDVYQIAAVRTPGYIYIFVYYTDIAVATIDAWTILRQRRVLADADPVANPWQQFDSMFDAEGILYTAIRLDAVWADNEVFFYGGRKLASTGVEIGQGLGWYWGGWTKRSLGLVTPSESLDDSNKSLQAILWHPGCGEPSVPVGSGWSKNTVATGVASLAMEDLTLTGTAAADEISYQIDLPNDIAAEAGGVIGMVLRMDTGDSDGTADNVACRIVGLNGGTFSVDISIRFQPGSSGVILYDNEAASTLATIAGVAVDTGATGANTEVRVWMQYDGSTDVKCQIAVLNTSGTDWIESSVVTLTKNLSPPANNRITFGHLGQVQATQMQSYWREVWVIDEYTGNQSGIARDGFAQERDLYGMQTTAEIVGVEEGLQVSWAGSGGVEGDSYAGPIEHRHAAGNVVVNSPRIDWRSGGTDPQIVQTMILDADPENGLERWEHDAIALFGINDRTITVDYDTTSAFSSPTSAIVLDATAFNTGAVAVVVASVEGSVIVATLPASLRWVAGELVDHYVRMTSGSSSGATFRITKHSGLLRIHCGDETASLAASGVSAADSFVIFANHAAGQYGGAINNPALRYMRLRFNDTDTAEGDHGLGTIVPGNKLSIDVPMDWAHTDNEQPNTTNFNTRSAIHWAFREGPEQRTVIGRVVGDAERWRDMFRHLVKQIGYDQRAVAFINDDEQEIVGSMLATITSGSQNDHAAYYRDTQGVLRKAGDLSITMVEEV